MDNNAQQRLERWGAKLGDLDKTLQEKPRCCKRKCLAGGIPATLLHDRRLDFYWTNGEQVLLLMCYYVLSSFTRKNKSFITCVWVHITHLSICRLPKKGCWVASWMLTPQLLTLSVAASSQFVGLLYVWLLAVQGLSSRVLQQLQMQGQCQIYTRFELWTVWTVKRNDWRNILQIIALSRKTSKVGATSGEFFLLQVWSGRNVVAKSGGYVLWYSAGPWRCTSAFWNETSGLWFVCQVTWVHCFLQLLLNLPQFQLK